MMQIPILRIPFSDDEKRAIAAGVTEILDSGMLTMSKHTRRFEEMYCEQTGARYAVATSNCTTALEIILRALGVHGRSVIVPTNTFLATALAVMHAGNRVVFADSDPATLCLDAADVERKTDGDTAAVILVHIGGVITSEVERIRKLCTSRGLYLIEDCAHAHGCTYSGQQAGTLGIAGAFSFFPTKVLVTGEGGMITTSDEGLYREAMKIRNHGKDPELGNRMSTFGNNYRMSEITALLGVEQMKKASTLYQERQSIGRQYDQLLDGAGHIQRLVLPPGVDSTYYKYIAYLEPGLRRDAVKHALKSRFGVSLTGEVYSELCHTEPIWQSFTFCGQPKTGHASHRWPSCRCGEQALGEFPGADRISRHHVCLPLYPGLSRNEIEYVVESVATVLADEANQRRPNAAVV